MSSSRAQCNMNHFHIQWSYQFLIMQGLASLAGPVEVLLMKPTNSSIIWIPKIKRIESIKMDIVSKSD